MSQSGAVSMIRFALESDSGDKRSAFLYNSCSWDDITQGISSTFGIPAGTIRSVVLFDEEDDDLSQPVVTGPKFWKYGSNYDAESGHYFLVNLQPDAPAPPRSKLSNATKDVLSSSKVVDPPIAPSPPRVVGRAGRVKRTASSPEAPAAVQDEPAVFAPPPPPQEIIYPEEAAEEKVLLGESESSEGEEFEESELLQAFVSNDMAGVNRLLNSESVHESDEQGRTLLHMACRQGMTSLVEGIVDLGGDPDVQDKAGRTPLHYACKYDHLSTVKYLVHIKSDLNIADKDKMVALHYACISGCSEITKMLVESGSVEIDFADKRGNTAVHYCCDTRNYPLAEWLTEVGGANIDKVNDDGLSAFGIVHNSGSVGFASVLMEKAAVVSIQRNILNKTKQLLTASTRGDWSIALNLVIDGAADVHTADENDKSVLSYACEAGSLQVVKAIVERGGRIQHKDKFGKSCLHYCCAKGLYDVVKYLVVETGRAALNDTDYSGHTELYYACTGGGNSELVKLLAQNGGDFRSAAESEESQHLLCKALAHDRDLVEYLIKECDFDIELLYSSGDDLDRSLDSEEFYTWAWEVKKRLKDFLTDSLCSYLRSRSDDIGPAQDLIRRGADVNVVLPMGGCPLHDACIRGKDDYVTFLIKQGAICTAGDAVGNTPLHIAAYFGHLEIIRWLKKSGAFLSAKNQAGYTPLHFACSAAQLSVSKWLVDRGANVHEQTNNGYTPFLLACESGSIEMVKWIEPMVKLAQFVPEGDHLNASAYKPIDHSVYSGNVELVNWWLQKRSCPNSVGTNYITRTKQVHADKTAAEIITAFRLSCFQGNVELCKKYVSGGVNINATENRPTASRELAPKYALDAADPMSKFDGLPVLNICCALGHEPIVNLLLEQPSLKCSARDHDGRSPLHVACLGGFSSIAGRLVKTGYFSELQLDSFGNSLLHLAIMSKNQPLVISLAERFALLDEDMKNGSGLSSICLAEQLELHSVLNWFHENPKHSRLVDELCAACASGNVVVMNRLVSQGAGVNSCDGDDMYPIHFAASNNQLLVVTRLLELRCNLNVLSPFLMSPLHYAADSATVEIVRCLVYGGADVNLTDINGMTAFLLSCSHGKIDMATFLIAQGADTTTINKKGQNALHLAVLSDSFYMVKCVIESCRDLLVDARDKNGLRPLDLATERFQMEMITCIQCAQIISYEQRIVDLEKKNQIELQKAEERSKAQAEMKEVYMQSEGEREIERMQRENLKEENVAMFLDACYKNQVDLVEEMLTGDTVNPNCQNGDGFTALHMACIAGNVTLARILLRFHVVVDMKNKHGCTPLYYACASGNDEIALMLVENGADFLCIANDGTTAMQCICAKDRAYLLRMLFKRDPYIDVNNREESSSSLLQVACINGSENIGLILLKKGAVVRGDVDANQSSLLHLAALTGSVKLCEGLLEYGADISARDGDGFTPLMRACTSGHRKLAQYLVSKGANINDRDPVGNTCLHFAAMTGSTEVCAWLAQQGLNVFSFNDDNTNILVIAKVKRHAELIKWLKSYILSIRAFLDICSSGNVDNIIQYMESNNIHPSVSNECFATAMHFACGAGELKACKHFLSLGCAVDDTDDEGLTPLHWACAGGHESVVKWLLGRGAKIGHKSHDGRNLLHRAAFHGQNRIATVLLNNRSFPYPIDETSENGFTPFFDACTSGHLKVAELLLFKGAELLILLPNGYNILHILCRQGRHEILSWALSNYSVSLTEYLDSGNSNNGTTPLMCACICGSVETLNALEAHRIDLSVALSRKTRRGDTALHLACFHGHLAAAQWLVHRGSDTSVLNSSRNSPLKIAILAKRRDVAEWLDDGSEIIPTESTHEKPSKLKQYEEPSRDASAPAPVETPSVDPSSNEALQNTSSETDRVPHSRRRQPSDPFALRQSKKSIMATSKNQLQKIVPELAEKSDDTVETLSDSSFARNRPTLAAGNLSSHRQPPQRVDPFSTGSTRVAHSREITSVSDKMSRKNPSASLLRGKLSGSQAPSTDFESSKLPFQRERNKGVHSSITDDVTIHVASANGNLQLVEKIVSTTPEKANELNAQGMSPLYIACDKKHESVALYLIRNGATLSTVCRTTGDTPLHRLCYRGLSRLLNQIIEQPTLGLRLDLDCKNDAGACPIHIAVSGFGDIDMIKYLLELGADAGVKDSDRMTALHYACKSRKLEVVKQLLSWSAPLNSQDKAGNTPLMLAVIADDAPIAKYLVEVKHAALTPRNSTGDTVLHLACKAGRLSMAEWLVVHNGMDPSARNNAKLTAVNCAEMGGFDHLAAKLEEWQMTTTAKRRK